MKEKGALAKDAWGVIGSAYVLIRCRVIYDVRSLLIGSLRLGAQSVVQEMEKLQAQGEIPEEELKALEEDVTGRV